MLYQAETRTAVEVVAPGTEVAEARMRELAALQGAVDDAGRVVERVALVFVGGADEARAHLPALKRFGLGCRAVDAGRQIVLYDGAASRRTDAEPEGTLLPVLREASWPHVASCAHRRLLGDALGDGPWVTFGWDSPTAIARVGSDDLGDRTLAELEAEALANLEARGFVPKEIERGTVVLPGEHCAEAILLPSVMKACAARLGARLMAVAIPKESTLAAVDAADPAQVSRLIGWTRELFDEARGRRISPLPLLVDDTGVVGLVTPRSGAPVGGEPGRKKPWYRFW